MARRRSQEPEEEGSGYNWMDTYGDMVTLLLCFFVLLYSFSTIDAEKWQQLIGAFAGSSSPSAIQSLDISTAKADPIPAIDPMVNYDNRDSANVTTTDAADEFDQLYQNIKNYIAEHGLEGQLSVTRTEDTIILRFGEVFLFDSGKATLLSSGEAALAHIMQITSENSSAVKRITIEGNTDNVPINNRDFSDNWDLSVARATNTLRRVLEYDVIDPTKLAAAGYGEYQPIDTNSTTEGRAHNRRVDFVIERVDIEN